VKFSLVLLNRVEQKSLIKISHLPRVEVSLQVVPSDSSTVQQFNICCSTNPSINLSGNCFWNISQLLSKMSLMRTGSYLYAVVAHMCLLWYSSQGASYSGIQVTDNGTNSALHTTRLLSTQNDAGRIPRVGT